MGSHAIISLMQIFSQASSNDITEAANAAIKVEGANWSGEHDLVQAVIKMN